MDYFFLKFVSIVFKRETLRLWTKNVNFEIFIFGEIIISTYDPLNGLNDYS